MKFNLNFLPSIQILRGLTFGLGLVCLTSCTKHSNRTATFGTGADLLAYGVYSAEKQDSHGLSSKISLNQNGTYSRKKFQGTCLLIESKGEWKSDHDALSLRMLELRKREECGIEDWLVEKVDRSTSRDIRNVTTNSFEILDQEEDVSAEWVRFVKR